MVLGWGQLHADTYPPLKFSFLRRIDNRSFIFSILLTELLICRSRTVVATVPRTEYKRIARLLGFCGQASTPQPLLLQLWFQDGVAWDMSLQRMSTFP